MRFLKLALLSIIILFLLITCIGLLLPSSVKVSRTIDIKASPYSIYYYIADIKNWPEWMEGVKKDSLKVLSANRYGNIVKAITGANKVSIVKATRDSIQTLWKAKNKQQQSNFLLIEHQPSKITTVNWYFLEYVSWYPWERIGSIMNDKILGPQMEKSLENLKRIAEQQ